MMRVVAALLLAACSPRGGATISPASPERPVPATSSEAPSCPAIAAPAGPPAQRLAHFLAAANATDDAAARAFVGDELARSFQAVALEIIRGLHRDGTTLALCRVEASTDDELLALVGRRGEQGELELHRVLLAVGGDDHRVASLGIEPATKDDLTRPIDPLDAALVGNVVEDVAKGLVGYVFAEKVAPMGAKIRAAHQQGAYAAITSEHILARRITDDLRSVTGDKHLGVVYSSVVLEPPPEGEPSAEEIAAFKKRAAADNFGMPVAEIREGNIGYLAITGFLPAAIAGEAIAATMTKIADADVLVIDLRDNGGGSPDGVALVSSYLFGKKKVHLNDIYDRAADRTERFYTTPTVRGRHFGAKKPIYVLTSSRTFSAGEEFAYNLQALKRATLVGETTGGGAHPTDFVRISDHWAIALPSARAINPITKTNWEGAGVKPDVEVPADHALEKALELAKARKSRAP